MGKKEHKAGCRCVSCVNNRVAEIAWRLTRVETALNWLIDELIKNGTVELPKGEESAEERGS